MAENGTLRRDLNGLRVEGVLCALQHGVLKHRYLPLLSRFHNIIHLSLCFFLYTAFTHSIISHIGQQNTVLERTPVNAPWML